MTLDTVNASVAAMCRERYPDAVPVFGDGLPDARIVLVGEAPGEQETKLGKPFVGKAGKNLDEFLSLAGLDRSALYVTNTVKLRPTKLSAAGRTVNRPPTRAEIADFLPFLRQELELIRPEYVVTLGNTPLQALTSVRVTIGEVHGHTLPLDGSVLYPMYHPASLIYNRSLRPVYEADILALACLLRQK